MTIPFDDRAREAWDIMMNLGWGVSYSRLSKGWMVDPGNDYWWMQRMPHIVCADPLDAIEEAYRWYRNNGEGKW